MSTGIDREAKCLNTFTYAFLNTFTCAKDRVQLDELNVKIWKQLRTFKGLYIENLA